MKLFKVFDDATLHSNIYYVVAEGYKQAEDAWRRAKVTERRGKEAKIEEQDLIKLPSKMVLITDDVIYYPEEPK